MSIYHFIFSRSAVRFPLLFSPPWLFVSFFFFLLPRQTANGYTIKLQGITNVERVENETEYQ